MRPSAVLDRLVADGRLSGYTVEEDTSYLEAERPTLTYRMYDGHSTSRRNLDEFCLVMAHIGADLRTSRLVGTMAAPGGLVRTDQICVTAAFDDDQMLGLAVGLVEDRFTCGPGAVAGSWRFPDVRISRAAPPGTIAVWAHRWTAAVALALSSTPPAPASRCVGVRVLACWTDLLTRRSEPAARLKGCGDRWDATEVYAGPQTLQQITGGVTRPLSRSEASSIEHDNSGDSGGKPELRPQR